MEHRSGELMEASLRQRQRPSPKSFKRPVSVCILLTLGEEIVHAFTAFFFISFGSKRWAWGVGGCLQKTNPVVKVLRDEYKMKRQ